VEIDPEIVRVGRAYFEMTMPNLEAIVADGRHYLSNSQRTYTIVGVDAYRLPYIPPHLTTVEFFREVYDHLSSDGVLAINVGHTPEDYRLVAAMVATMRQVFPSTHVIDVPRSYNTVVVATVQPSEPGNLMANIPSLEGNEFLHATAMNAAANLRPVEPGPTIFTDDRAAIEWMTNALVVAYVLKGE
jgi:spermidine synthase